MKFAELKGENERNEGSKRIITVYMLQVKAYLFCQDRTATEDYTRATLVSIII
jgi:hypothetical protein